MSTPNPILVAASPVLKQALTDMLACVTTILTGDPAQIGLRAGPAFGILVNQLILLDPSLLAAAEGTMLTEITTKMNGLIARLP